MRVFIVPRSPGAPQPAPPLTFPARSVDEARAIARERLELDGFRIRTLTTGPAGIVAYVEESGP